MSHLTSQLRRDMKEYARLIEAQKRGENVKQRMVQILTQTIELLKDIRNIYESASQNDPKVRQAIERMDRLIKTYETKLFDLNKFY